MGRINNFAISKGQQGVWGFEPKQCGFQSPQLLPPPCLRTPTHFLALQKNNFYIDLFIGGGGGIHVITHVWRSEGSLKGQFSPSNVGPEDEIQAIRTGGQCFYPLNYLASPWLFLDGKSFAFSKLHGSEWQLWV